MKMIGHQGPCKTADQTVAQNTANPIQKITTVAVVPENLPPIDSSDDDVMQRTRSVDLKSPWHAAPLPLPTIAGNFTT